MGSVVNWLRNVLGGQSQRPPPIRLKNSRHPNENRNGVGWQKKKKGNETVECDMLLEVVFFPSSREHPNRRFRLGPNPQRRGGSKGVGIPLRKTRNVKTLWEGRDEAHTSILGRNLKRGDLVVGFCWGTLQKRGGRPKREVKEKCPGGVSKFCPGLDPRGQRKGLKVELFGIRKARTPTQIPPERVPNST